MKKSHTLKENRYKGHITYMYVCMYVMAALGHDSLNCTVSIQRSVHSHQGNCIHNFIFITNFRPHYIAIENSIALYKENVYKGKGDTNISSHTPK